MIIDAVSDIASPPIFIRLREFDRQRTVHLKLEGLNVAGSIKLKTAREMMDNLEAQGVLHRGSKIIESSSGNLGVALAFLCAERGYPFTCVSDPNISPPTHRLIAALGARVVIVKERHPQGGYLQSRLQLVQQMLSEDSELVWTNQYANRANAQAHYRTTGREILASFPAPNWVFVGAGTTGTLAGIGRLLREKSPSTCIVAVDSVGSVTFGGAPSPRYLPGMGTSVRPSLADDCVLDRLVRIDEIKAVDVCSRLARRYGLLLGPSTGSVLAAVEALHDEIGPQDSVVAVSPDFGDRYVETLYNQEWVRSRFEIANQAVVADTTLSSIRE